jgi:hypothetical protein
VDTGITSIISDLTRINCPDSWHIGMNALDAMGTKFTNWILSQSGLQILGSDNSLTVNTIKTIIISLAVQFCVTCADVISGTNYK